VSRTCWSACAGVTRGPLPVLRELESGHAEPHQSGGYSWPVTIAEKLEWAQGEMARGPKTEAALAPAAREGSSALRAEMVALPRDVVEELVEARQALETSEEESNPGEAQRRMLRDKRAMEKVCELVRKAWKP
jgi:hypothetical protein